MTNVIKNSIPNTVTCLNLFSGCIACVMAFEANYELALLFIALSSIFDFFDGLLARALNAHSIIGKDLDSLADDVSFGVAPSLIVFSLFKEMYYPANMEFIAPYLPYLAFLISVFSALRLAKFNNDTRQTSSFVGLPVPANALFWGSLVAGAHDFLISDNCHPVYLLILVCLFSGLLVSEIPMFSLKFKNLSWNDNKISFIFLIICIPLLIFLGISSFAAIIVWYILLSLFTRKSAIFVFGLSIVGFILRTIFGLGRSSSSSRPKQTESGRTSQQSYNQTNRRSNDDEEEIYSENVPEKRHKKIFTQDDGEYVDFEEIK